MDSRISKVIGRDLPGVGLVVIGADIALSKNHTRTAVGDISGAVAGAVVGAALIEFGPLGIAAGMATDYFVSQAATSIYDHYHGGAPKDEQ